MTAAKWRPQPYSYRTDFVRLYVLSPKDVLSPIDVLFWLLLTDTHRTLTPAYAIQVSSIEVEPDNWKKNKHNPAKRTQHRGNPHHKHCRPTNTLHNLSVRPAGPLISDALILPFSELTVLGILVLGIQRNSLQYTVYVIIWQNMLQQNTMKRYYSTNCSELIRRWKTGSLLGIGSLHLEIYVHIMCVIIIWSDKQCDDGLVCTCARSIRQENISQHCKPNHYP